MKLTLRIYCLLILATLFVISGCKYDEGPLISLRSKRKRVINSWKYDVVKRNELNVTNGSPEFSIIYSESSIGFGENGRFSTIIAYNDSLTNFPVQHDGSWEFSEEKEQIIMFFDAPYPLSGETQTWDISKLREKDLWTEEQFGDNRYYYRLVPN